MITLVLYIILSTFGLILMIYALNLILNNDIKKKENGLKILLISSLLLFSTIGASANEPSQTEINYKEFTSSHKIGDVIHLYLYFDSVSGSYCDTLFYSDPDRNIFDIPLSFKKERIKEDFFGSFMSIKNCTTDTDCQMKDEFFNYGDYPYFIGRWNGSTIEVTYCYVYYN